MKLSNVKVGKRIQAKSTKCAVGYSVVPNESYEVLHVAPEYHGLRVQLAVPRNIHSAGVLWVDEKHFRKEVPPVLTNADIKVGDFIAPIGTQCTPYSYFHLEQGKPYEILEIRSCTGSLKIPVSTDIHQGGVLYVKAEYFTKVEPEDVQHTYSVGDKVLVGAEGAGFNRVDRDLANKVCEVVSVQGGLNQATILSTELRKVGTYSITAPVIEQWVDCTVDNVKVGDTLKIVSTSGMDCDAEVGDEVIVTVNGEGIQYPSMYVLIVVVMIG